MNSATPGVLGDLVRRNREGLLDDWVREQLRSPTRRPDLVPEGDLRKQSSLVLDALSRALVAASDLDPSAAGFEPVREALVDLSALWARQGVSPVETASFIFSLRRPLFELLSRELLGQPEALTEEIWKASDLVDRLGLYTTEAIKDAREAVIQRQRQELMELSTPVVKLWEGILALPLIGTLDSARTQVVMEGLLQGIVDTGADVAIIDITGVPVVDTLVAQHLLKTVAAARLMGADCIISGIRPQIAQTIVHLGVELNEVTTKATLADAFRVALKRTDQRGPLGSLDGPRP
ncbi:MAG TPA: STAS domain-containing protein [Armatimonadota bacterium]|jgi:rsbT co-antagonist protein RsbR